MHLKGLWKQFLVRKWESKMKRMLFFMMVLFGVIYIKNKEINDLLEDYSVEDEE